MEKKFACGHCWTIADTEDEANQCCSARDVWVCSICGDYVEEETKECDNCEQLSLL